MSGEGDTGAAAVDIPEPPTADRWRIVRLAAYCGYFAVIGWLLFRNGVPTDRLPMALMVMSGLAVSGIGRGWRVAGQIILDWLPFTLVLVLYDRTRGVADGVGLPLHENDILDAEKWLFGGTEPTLWLQQHLYDAAHVHWYDALVTLIYTSHFLATPVLAAVLWLRDRASWLRFISRVVVLAVAGLITYCLVPSAPPWMAAQDGLSAPVARLSTRGWVWLHADNLDTTLSNAQKGGGANPVAAMPSLHLAFAVLVAVMLARMIRSRWRYLLALYPLAMAFTLVYTGEHYVLDLVAGAIYALAAHFALNRWDRWRAARPADQDRPATGDSRKTEQLIVR